MRTSITIDFERCSPSLSFGEVLSMLFSNNAFGKVQRRLELKFARSELHLLNRFRRLVVRENELLQICRSVEVDDMELAQRLHDAGFGGESVAALKLFPIAMAAWASGTVSPAERRHAEQAIFDSDVSGNSAAIELFRKWLESRPSDALWELWQDFVRSTSQDKGRIALISERGRTVWLRAKQVALASGGFLGLGSVCSSERDVLDRIERAYALR